MTSTDWISFKSDMHSKWHAFKWQVFWLAEYTRHSHPIWQRKNYNLTHFYFLVNYFISTKFINKKILIVWQFSFCLQELGDPFKVKVYIYWRKSCQPTPGALPAKEFHFSAFLLSDLLYSKWNYWRKTSVAFSTTFTISGKFWTEYWKYDSLWKITTWAFQVLRISGAFWQLSTHNCGPQFPK
jgi:hypothetical protein